jgi:oligopeptidase B
VAQRIDRRLEAHGDVRVDPYYWLRDDARQAPAVLAYLAAENAYTAAVMAPLKGLSDALVEEIKGRLAKDDASVPVEDDGYWTYTRFEAGAEHPKYCRRKGTMAAPEELLLDVDAQAKGHGYYQVTGVTISRGGALLAYAEDVVGRRIHTIRIKDLTNGKLLPDRLEGTSGSLAWANDGKTLFYVKRDPTTLRERAVHRHTLGTPQSADVLVHDEADEAYYVAVRTSKSRAFVFIEMDSTLVTETLVRSADDPVGPFRAVLPREANHEYRVWHHRDRFYLRTNWQARNFRLMSAPVAASADKARWTEVIAHREDALLDNVAVFDQHLVVAERVDALRRLRIVRWRDKAERLVPVDEAIYVTALDDNPSFSTAKLRYVYSSPVTPESVYEVDMETLERRLLKRDKILGGYDPTRYETARLWAPARDGQRIPISLVYPKGTPRDGSAPLYLYGYGSYGHTIDPWFRPSWVSLLERGVVVGVAHIRGSQALGRRWYDDGKMAHKMNTFTDFIDATEHLVAQGWSRPARIAAAGGSAGGLLMGAIANLRPDLYRAIHAAVPFVDVVTTMLDASIPLTTNEYDEWGNPATSKASYLQMLAYSPYDQVKAQAYPHLYVTTGLHDSQVQYFEPAKWVAKLRATKTDGRLLLLETEMEAGHGGAAGRFKRFEQTARVYAFLLHVLGLPER